MVYINTLLIQEILADPLWKTKLMPEDMRALSPLIHTHINPYGLFPLDLKERLLIEEMIKTQVTCVSNAGIPPTVGEAVA